MEKGKTIKKLTLSDVFNKLQADEAAGKKQSWFFNAEIRKEDLEIIKKSGYTVLFKIVRGRPNYKISW